jgi:hypothetical protein
VTIPADLNEERDRRLANQHMFRQYYVKCSCERGCHVCAYTSLVTKAHARRPFPATS